MNNSITVIKLIIIDNWALKWIKIVQLILKG